MPYSVASYADIGGSPFQQYVNQQQQFQLQQQQAQRQQNTQQNQAFGGQNPQLPGLQGGQPQYGQQQYGQMPQYNPLPSYNLNQNQGFQPTPIGQADYTTYRGTYRGFGMEAPQGQTFVPNPSKPANAGAPNYNFNMNAAEQSYLQQQQPYPSGYNSLPTYNPFQLPSPSGGTGQFYSTY